MEKCKKISSKNLKEISKKYGVSYKNKTKTDLCKLFLNSYYVKEVTVEYNFEGSKKIIKKYISHIIHSFVRLNCSLESLRIKYIIYMRNNKNLLNVTYIYNTFTTNDPDGYITPIQQFKFRINGIRYEFHMLNYFIDYIKPHENKLLMKNINSIISEKSIKTSIPSFNKMPNLTSLNLEQPINSHVYYNISTFLNQMKITINTLTNKPYISKNVYIIDVKRNHEIMYNISNRSFIGIEYLINNIMYAFNENKIYIATPLIFQYPDINHATGLFIDTVRKKVEYFDSLNHERHYYYFIVILEKYFKNQFPDKPWMHKLTYIDIYKKDLFLQKTIDIWGGACVIYTTIYLTMRSMYPKMSLQHIKVYFDNKRSIRDKENVLKKFSNFVFKTNRKQNIIADVDYFLQ